MTLIAKDEYCYNCGQMHPRWIDGCTNAKNLQQHIEQMAEKLSKKGWNDGQKAGLDIGYQQGFKDADAVGFIEWYFNSSDFQRFNKGSFRNPFGIKSTEELYLTYLKTKTK